MKYNLSLLASSRPSIPARKIEMEDKDILCNNVVLPNEFNPNNVRLWVIGHEFGAICAVWAANELIALDEAMDENRLDCFLASEEGLTEDEKEELTYLGNASEACDLTYAWMQEVDISKTLENYDLLLALCEARGACAKTLYK